MQTTVITSVLALQAYSLITDKSFTVSIKYKYRRELVAVCCIAWRRFSTAGLNPVQCLTHRITIHLRIDENLKTIFRQISLLKVRFAVFASRSINNRFWKWSHFAWWLTSLVCGFPLFEIPSKVLNFLIATPNKIRFQQSLLKIFRFIYKLQASQISLCGSYCFNELLHIFMRFFFVSWKLSGSKKKNWKKPKN